jgi:hypothetical protein
VPTVYVEVVPPITEEALNSVEDNAQLSFESDTLVGIVIIACYS